MSTKIVLFCLCLNLYITATFAAGYEYRYLECENYTAGEGYGLREEGFTPWMRHPSQGQVMVLGGAGNWLEYDLAPLGEGNWNIYLRGLGWAGGCDVEVIWDGESLGIARYDVPGTALKWSRKIATIKGDDQPHKLRLAGAAGITQAPYLDAVLLTTQGGYVPSDEDEDFKSFITSVPLLELQLGDKTGTLRPEPGDNPNNPEISIQRLAAGAPGLGKLPLRMTLRNETARGKTVDAMAWIVGGEKAALRQILASGETAEAALGVMIEQVGPVTLEVGVWDDATKQMLARGTFKLRIPDPVAVDLSEYAVPTGTETITWRGHFATTAAVAREFTVNLQVAGQTAPVATQILEDGLLLQAELDASELAPGRYQVTAAFSRKGKLIATLPCEFEIYEPVAWETWEPVQKTEAQGGLVLLNGKPFLPRLLYHATATEELKTRGFNMVQCWGGDPDPVESMQEHLDACEKAGMWGTLALFNNQYLLTSSGFNMEHLQQVVERFRNHPALFAWDLVDEPDGMGFTPEQVAEGANLVRQLDPNHLVWVNLCMPDRGLEWLESQDVWSFDTYPLPKPGLSGFKQWLEIGDKNLLGKKPLGTCLQTYQNPGLPMPTPQQLRASALLHIIYGYAWFGYYSYYDGPPAGCLVRDPELLSFVNALNADLVRLSPAIFAPGQWQHIAAEKLPEGCFAATKQVGGKQYLIAINGTESTQEITLEIDIENLKILIGDKSDTNITDKKIKITLPPWGNMVGHSPL